MAQRSNVLTLRKTNNINLLGAQHKEFEIGFNYLSNLEHLFNARNVFITNLELNFSGNKVSLNLFCYFRAAKLLQLKKKISTSYGQKPLQAAKNKKFCNLLLAPLLPIQKNLIMLRVCNLNSHVYESLSKKLQVRIYYFFKRSGSILFPRRFNFFLDTIKLFFLFLSGKKVPSKFFLNILGEIFKILQKRRHVRFIYFIKEAFKLIITQSQGPNKILGIKFQINGKLKGKPRSSNYLLIVGRVPNQTYEANIDYAKSHVYTVYGAFGFKFWVYRK